MTSNQSNNQQAKNPTISVQEAIHIARLMGFNVKTSLTLRELIEQNEKELISAYAYVEKYRPALASGQ